MLLYKKSQTNNEDDSSVSVESSLDKEKIVHETNDMKTNFTIKSQRTIARESTNQDTQSNDVSFAECPYYEINWKESKKPIRIPLETSPRAGMLETEMLLFTNGRKTIVFDPIKRRYFSGVESSKYENQMTSVSTSKKEILGVDLSMPEMKNVEVYAARNGTIYLIGGKLIGLVQLFYMKMMI